VPTADEPLELVRLSAGGPDDTLIRGKAVLVISGEPIDVELAAPDGLVAVEDVLPILHGLSSHFAERAATAARAQGRSISCRAGCGACCRQLVPVAGAEARALARLVEAMPQPRQSEVRRRFDAAIDILTAAGIPERFAEGAPNRHELGLDYFRQEVACPFLEDEACSIHADRPLSCREYLVTNPAENCLNLGAADIDKLTLEGDPSLALLKADFRDGWLPLVFCLTYDEQAPPSARDRTASQILGDILGRL